MTKDALIVVDVQNDFCEGGALAVPNASEILGPLNRLIAHAELQGWPLFFSQDWHPAETVHFDKWPAHCVEYTPGAAFRSGLYLPPSAIVVRKGEDPLTDQSYSAFTARDATGNSLADLLRYSFIRSRIGDVLREHRDATTLHIVGLAADFCVLETALDAVRLGYRVQVHPDCTRAVFPAEASTKLLDFVAKGGVLANSDAFGPIGPLPVRKEGFVVVG